jgi:site-specific DNA-cytosine methylase
LLAGSPCQGFSFAGKQLNFKDERSKLFFEFIKAKETLKPKYFLLENVIMKKEYQNAISALVGCEPIRIESSLFSAKKRSRLYWTNIPVLPYEDKKIFLKDILEDGVVDRDKSYCIDANYFRGTNLEQYLTKKRRQVVFNYSSSGRGNGKVESRHYESDKAQALCASGYSNRSSTNVIEVNNPIKLGETRNSMGYQVYDTNGKSICLKANGGGIGSHGGLYHDDYCIRKLTPIECERLQTVPDNYTNHVSKSQRYKMLGNGWTVDVIAHILKGMDL